MSADTDLGPVHSEPEVIDATAVAILDSRPPSARAGGARKHRMINILGPIAVFVVIVGMWYGMHYWALEHVFDRGQHVIPPPHEVISESFSDDYFRGQLLEGLMWTAIVAAVGLVIAIVVGVLLAIVMSMASWFEISLWPYLIALQAIPILAIVPIIALVLGYGYSARLFVCVIISLFPIVSNTLFGLLSADRGQHDLFTLGGASRTTRLWKLQLPAALPAMFTGFRIASGLSVIGAVVGELFFRRGNKGIGLVMDVFRQRNQNPPMFGALILSALLGIAFFAFFGWLGKMVVGRWHETTRKTG